MKYILIALLFCICYVGEAQKVDTIMKIIGKSDGPSAIGIGRTIDFIVYSDTTPKPLIDSTGIRMAKDLGFPKYNGQTILLFDREGDANRYYDSVGWIVKDNYAQSSLPERFSPKTIDSIVKHSESPWIDTLPAKPLNIKSKWSDASQGKFIPSFWIDTLPAKPLNIKMKPRWRGCVKYDTIYLAPLHAPHPIYDSGWLSKGGYDTFLHKVDSIKSKKLKQ